MIEKRIIASIAERNAVLFIGAGFSLGATAASGEPVKSGSQLRELLNKDLNLPAHYMLDAVSQFFKESYGETELWRVLRSSFSVTSVRDYHRGIATLPWKRVYTTNYDDCFEKACELAGIRYATIVRPEGLGRSKTGTLEIVHLNGSICGSNEEDLQNAVRLTESSYASQSMLQSPLFVRLREDVVYAESVVYVGYSMACLGSPANGMFRAWLTQCKRILLRDFAASCGEGLSHKPKSEWKGAVLRKGPLLIPTLGSTTLGLHLCRALSFV